MTYEIILAGVGGQGVISSATIISRCAMFDGFFVRQSEIHGMAQRGGAVQAQVRIADKPVESDQVPSGSADCIISLEPIEGLRHVRLLRKNGIYITSLEPIANSADYPEPEFILKQLNRIPGHIAVEVDAISQSAQSAYTTNTALIGIASIFLPLLTEAAFKRTISEVFERKGTRVVADNLTSFGLGRKIGEERK